jgi:hypothetical protein
MLSSKKIMEKWRRSLRKLMVKRKQKNRKGRRNRLKRFKNLSNRNISKQQQFQLQTNHISSNNPP